MYIVFLVAHILVIDLVKEVGLYAYNACYPDSKMKKDTLSGVQGERVKLVEESL
jgi:hypothetical protein